VVGICGIFYAWVVFVATHAKLPDPHHPIQFYSNQTRHDIKLTFLQALKGATGSLFLSVYGITDPELLDMVRKKAENQITVQVEYDPTASAPLKKMLPPPIETRAVTSSGLMHRKVIVIDHAQIFLGSANLTPTSLIHHANLVLGLYHPPLAAFLESPTSPSFGFEVQGQKGELYLFPDPLKSGLVKLLEQINAAKKSIYVAMFTLTHAQIGDALMLAKQRGIDVAIAIDAYTARGASKKLIHRLEQKGIRFYLSQGKELLHHKWALIDEETLVLGSANWTKAAFSKNHDFLLFLYSLKKTQTEFLKQLWKVIEAEAVDLKAAS
jgi:phosphatidylserine/phosphatidylglycerophosphate/cardiolipin synthase-like enzyme